MLPLFVFDFPEPERALDAYEKALNYNPEDPILASKMGIALVKTHNFKKAVNFYQEAIKLTENSDLKMDLAKLHILLKEFDKAEIVIKEELESNRKAGDEDFLVLQSRTKSLLLLSDIQEKSGNITQALSTLKEAKDCQNRVQKQVPLEQPGKYCKYTYLQVCYHLI